LKVLSFLMHHQDQIISRTTLTEHIDAQDFDRDSNTIDVFIGRLRKKIPDHMIETVRGLGYRLHDSS
jgi:two-component system OmpR family response regulator